MSEHQPENEKPHNPHAPEVEEVVKKKKRFFSYKEKEECWEKAPYMIGRHPDRWRLDAFGNPVNKFLKGCMGAFCYTYDHIVPFSKGGPSETENCQILGTYLNLLKSNRTELNYSEFRQFSPEFNNTEQELDVLEKAVFGNVMRPTLDSYVNSQKSKIENNGNKESVKKAN